MKVAVFGATGGIGKWAVKHALAKGYEVTAYVRNPQKIEEKHERLEVVKGALTDTEAIRKVLKGKDAVVWCVSMWFKDIVPTFENILHIMEEEKVQRLIHWATPSVHSREDKRSLMISFPTIVASIFATKARKDMIDMVRKIESSSLQWTIVRFLKPTNGGYREKTKVSFGDVSIKWTISREDIAAFMVAQIENKEYIHRMPIIGS